MLQALYDGVSGLQSFQSGINVIGNNIANVDTTGYKSQSISFEDQLYDTIQGSSPGNGTTIGGTNGVQTGDGVKVAAINTNMTQGQLQSTSNSADMAVQGNGFFVTSDQNGLGYTRDGSFNVDGSGNLVTATGSSVLGWTANSAGAIDNTQPITSASTLSIPVGVLTASTPTTTVNMGGNLSADSTTSTTNPYTRSVKVYDSQGNAQTATLTFTPVAGTPNSWTWSAAGANISPTSTGTITFNTSGAETAATGQLVVTPTSGSASPQNITMNFAGLTQLSGSSTVAASSQNGVAPGTLQSYSVDSTGTIQGVFSNGLTQPIGQIALANFTNPQGLTNEGDNTYQESANSGQPNLGFAAASGFGTISSGYVEQSNVDLSNEFSNMIVTQQGFSANSKIITTVNTMLSDIMQMVQG